MGRDARPDGKCGFYTRLEITLGKAPLLLVDIKEERTGVERRVDMVGTRKSLEVGATGGRSTGSSVRLNGLEEEAYSTSACSGGEYDGSQRRGRSLCNGT